MTSYLPEPGSIWRNAITGAPMRVVLSDETEIIAHDCELKMRDGKQCMVSWMGNLEAFFQMFTPEPYPELYPETAS